MLASVVNIHRNISGEVPKLESRAVLPCLQARWRLDTWQPRAAAPARRSGTASRARRRRVVQSLALQPLQDILHLRFKAAQPRPTMVRDLPSGLPNAERVPQATVPRRAQPPLRITAQRPRRRRMPALRAERRSIEDIAAPLHGLPRRAQCRVLLQPPPQPAPLRALP